MSDFGTEAATTTQRWSSHGSSSARAQVDASSHLRRQSACNRRGCVSGHARRAAGQARRAGAGKRPLCSRLPFSAWPTAVPSKLTLANTHSPRRNLGSRCSTSFDAAGHNLPSERLLVDGSNWRSRPRGDGHSADLAGARASYGCAKGLGEISLRSERCPIRLNETTSAHEERPERHTRSWSARPCVWPALPSTPLAWFWS